MFIFLLNPDKNGVLLFATWLTLVLLLWNALSIFRVLYPLCYHFSNHAELFYLLFIICLFIIYLFIFTRPGHTDSHLRRVPTVQLPIMAGERVSVISWYLLICILYLHENSAVLQYLVGWCVLGYNTNSMYFILQLFWFVFCSLCSGFYVLSFCTIRTVNEM